MIVQSNAVTTAPISLTTLASSLISGILKAVPRGVRFDIIKTLSRLLVHYSES